MWRMTLLLVLARRGTLAGVAGSAVRSMRVCGSGVGAPRSEPDACVSAAAKVWERDWSWSCLLRWPMEETRRRNLRTLSRLEGECLSEEAGEAEGEPSESTT